MTGPDAAGPPAHWTIQIDGGPCFQVSRDEDALLRGALRAGQPWPYECSVGGCGACRYELLDGQVDDLWPQAPGLSARERQRGRRLACQSAVRSDLRLRVRLDAEAPPAPVAPRRFQARLASVRALTADLSEFSFHADGPARFLPGQYALMHLHGVPGARAYSMSNLPNGQGLWQFIVRQVPQGRGSGALFGGVAPGQAVDVDGPYGHAYLREDSARDIVCIAGGSGLGPMLSIVRGALAAGGTRRVQLFVGMRSQADLGGLEALAGIAGDPRLVLTTVLSAPADAPAWSGPSGFVHAEVERRLATPYDRFDFYFAGPPPMIDAVQDLLMVRQRVPFGQIHFDRFV